MAEPGKPTHISTPTTRDAQKPPGGEGGSREAQAPLGYKIIKVRKPDGTIVKVKRPIVPGQVSADKKVAELKSGSAIDGPTESIATPDKKDGEDMSVEKPPAATIAAKDVTSKDTTTSKETQKLPSNPKSAMATPQKVSTASPVQPNHRSSRPFFSAFTTRAITALIPSIGEIGEFHDGDEVVDDGNDSDGFDDDDNEEDNYENSDDHHGDSTDQHQKLENNVAMAGATGLAAGLAAPPAQVRTPNGATKTYTKSGVQVTEKSQSKVGEIDMDEKVKSGEPEARSLHESYTDWTRYVICFIVISFPLLFIVLGILTTVLPSKPYGGNYGQGIHQAIIVAVSAWPIIFAAIAAQSLRAIASYKVERGIRLMTLEQLMGSNSVASSIKQPFLLRRFDMVTIALLLLWSLSPLATQALQRMSYPSEQYTSSNVTVYYVDTWTRNSVYNNETSYKTQSSVGYGDIIKQFFTASTIPSARDQAVYQDPWGNPKVPVLEYLDASVVDSEGWVDTSTATKNGDYSSNYGIPLEQLQVTDASYNFVMSSSYLNFNCSPIVKLHPAQFNKTDNLTVGVDISNQGVQTTYLKIIPQNETNSGRVIFAAFVNIDPSSDVYNPDLQDVYAYSSCEFNQTFVDSQVGCYLSPPSGTNTSSEGYSPGSSACIIQAIRPTKLAPQKSTMGDFTGAFMDSAGSILNSYLYDPTNVTGLYDGNFTSNILTVSTTNFTQRMGLLINTYWQLGFAPTVQDGGLNHVTAFDIYTTYVQNTTAGVTITSPIYAVSWGWIVALFICSVTLLLAGLTSILLDARTIVPDMLGFASTLARKSKYVDLPKVNSSMSGAERARLLGDHMVMMQDVKPLAPVGRVALGSASSSAKRLEKGRPYR